MFMENVVEILTNLSRYSRIVKRIYNNPSPVKQRTARKLLGWITVAKRPMKWHEIQGATSIDVKQSLVNFGGRQLPDHIRDICGSLIEILPGDRVQLVHTTAHRSVALKTMEAFRFELIVNPRYLIENKHIDVPREERQLALLSLQYLTFGCFDDSNTHDEILRFLKSGSYSFMDYASLHWNHHLEAAIDSLHTEDLYHSGDLGIALNEFFEMYQPGTTKKDATYEDLVRRCADIKTAECYETLVLLLSGAKSSRLAEEKLEALGHLGTMITKVRTTIEELSASASLDLLTKENLRRFYGDNWHKCSHHACYYFHEGFATSRGLLQHTNRHEKPFCCTEMGCTRMYIGWSTEKELKKHMSQYHPDPESFSWKFPHVKKPSSTFTCNLCPKQFTRASTLNTHRMREHDKERPFTCKTCGKGFVRKYECDRHEDIHAKKGPKYSEQLEPEAVISSRDSVS
jgi:hypothetical protein